MIRGRDVFPVMTDFLVKFFAGPHAREPNLYVVAGETGEADQVPRQIHNLDRFPHVKDENLSPTAHGGRLQDQLTRLRDRHEVAFHVRMRHGYRATVVNLA